MDIGVTRLLWVGKERTIESSRGFFTTIGEEITSRIVFICSDMWEPYLKVIRENCSEALHILDRFHNYFRAQKLISSGVVGGLNNKAKVTMRKSYGFRAFVPIGYSNWPSITHLASCLNQNQPTISSEEPNA